MIDSLSINNKFAAILLKKKKIIIKLPDKERHLNHSVFKEPKIHGFVYINYFPLPMFQQKNLRNFFL